MQHFYFDTEIVEIEDVKVEVSEDQEVILQHKVKEEVVNVDQVL